MKNDQRLLYRRLGLIAAAALLLGLSTPLLLHSLNPPTDPATELASFEKPPIPDEKNAARWLQAGAGAIVWSKEEQTVIGNASLLPYREWSPESTSTVRTFLDTHREALKIMAKARNLKDSSYGLEYSRNFKWQWSSALQFIRAARLLADQARMGFGTCDLTSAYGALATLGKMASTLEDESGMIAVLFGIAIDRIWLSVATEALSVDVGCPPELDRIEALMPEADLDEMLRRTFNLQSANFRLILAGENSAERKNQPSDEEIVDLLGNWITLIGTPIGPGRKQVEELVGRTNDTLKINGMGLHWTSLIGRTQSVQALRQEVCALIALRRLGAARGSFPADRPDIPELQRADPLTGKPLLYTRNADGSLTLKIDADEEFLKYSGGPSAGATMGPITLPAP